MSSVSRSLPGLEPRDLHELTQQLRQLVAITHRDLAGHRPPHEFLCEGGGGWAEVLTVVRVAELGERCGDRLLLHLAGESSFSLDESSLLARLGCPAPALFVWGEGGEVAGSLGVGFVGHAGSRWAVWLIR